MKKLLWLALFLVFAIQAQAATIHFMMHLVDAGDTIVFLRVEDGVRIDSATWTGAQAVNGIDTTATVDDGKLTTFRARVVFLSDLTVSANYTEIYDRSRFGSSASLAIVIGATDTAGADANTLVSGVPVTLLDAAGNQIGEVQTTSPEGYTSWRLPVGAVITVQTSSNVHNLHLFEGARTFTVGQNNDTITRGHVTSPTDSVLRGDDLVILAPANAAMATVSGTIRSGADTNLARITVEISIRETNIFDTATLVMIAPVPMKVRTLANGTWSMPLIRNEFFNKDIPYILNAYKGSKRYFTNREFRIPDGATTYVVTWP